MPHQCTKCEISVPDGSDEVFEGCPNCGSNVFQYIQSDVSSEDPSSEEPSSRNEQLDESKPSKSGVSSDVNEDSSQHEARTDIIDATPPQGSTDEEPTVSEFSSGSSSEAQVEDISQLQEELNSQFDGIHVLEPGQYEINITQLFHGDEAVIELRDDGSYKISDPGTN